MSQATSERHPATVSGRGARAVRPGKAGFEKTHEEMEWCGGAAFGAMDAEFEVDSGFVRP